jgi:hypothetical protein
MLPPRPISVHPEADYQLALKFANGESGILDMRPYLTFGIFNRLNDRAVFAQAAIHFDTVEWPCGVDLDPVFVYQKCKISNSCQQD